MKIETLNAGWIEIRPREVLWLADLGMFSRPESAHLIYAVLRFGRSGLYLISQEDAQRMSLLCGKSIAAVRCCRSTGPQLVLDPGFWEGVSA